MTRRVKSRKMDRSSFTFANLPWHALMPQITTTILLLHLVLGCCWHHAHGCETNCCDAPAASAAACACDAHGDGHAAGHDGRCGPDCGRAAHEQDRGESHHCDGARCGFVRAEPPTAPDGDLEPDFYLFLGGADIRQQSAVLRFLNCAILAGPPLRTHLLLGVLLI